VSGEALAQLEARASAAEELILLLRRQIGQVKVAQGGAMKAAWAKETDQLKVENSQLKEQVEVWKNKLIAAEKANGKKDYFSKPQDPKSDCIAKKVDTPAAEVVKEDAPKKETAKKEKKPKAEKVAKPAKPAEDEAPVDIGRLDLRVGHIRSAKKHPDADALYVEEVDVGEEKARTVISGLVRFVPEEEMQDRMAVILCNLKPSKMRGIMSEAMVMCASTPDKVEILAPPAGAKPGDVVEVAGIARAPDAQLNPKKKIFEAVAPDLRVNAALEATYKGEKWTVNGGAVTAQTLVNVNIK